MGPKQVAAARSATLSVSTTATWSRAVVIHARCDQHFWASAAVFFFTTTSVAFTTPRPLSFAFASQASCNLTGDAFAPGDTRIGRQRFAVCTGFGGVRHRREGIQHNLRSMGMRGINGACLSAVTPSTTLSPSVAGFTRSLAGTLGHTSWCNLLTW